MPGFADCHIHVVSTLLSSGKLSKLDCDDVLNKIKEIESSITIDALKHAMKVIALRSMISGVTLIGIHGVPQSIIETRLRTLTISTSPRIKDESTRTMFRYLDPDINLLELVKELQELKNSDYDLFIHIPMSKTYVFRLKSKYGLFPIEFLGKYGILDSRTSLIHCDWITNWEIGLVSRTRTKIIASPISTAIHCCGGFVPIYELITKDVDVGLGTDLGLAMGLDFIELMKMTLLMYRYNYGDLRLNINQLLYIATIGGYEVLGFKGGAIREGYLADIVLLDADQVDVDELPYSVLNMDKRSISMVIVGGEIVYESKEFNEVIRIINNELRYLRELYG